MPRAWLFSSLCLIAVAPARRGHAETGYDAWLRYSPIANAAVRAIRAMDLKAVVIKRGDAGSPLFHDAGVFSAPAFPIEKI